MCRIVIGIQTHFFSRVHFITGEIVRSNQYDRPFNTMLGIWKRILKVDLIEGALSTVDPGSRYDYLILPLVASRLAIRFMNRNSCGCDGGEFLGKNDSDQIPPEYLDFAIAWNDAYTEAIHARAKDWTFPFHEVLPFLSLATMTVAQTFLKKFESRIFWNGMIDETNGVERAMNRWFCLPLGFHRVHWQVIIIITCVFYTMITFIVHWNEFKWQMTC